MNQDILDKFEGLFDDYLNGNLDSINQSELEKAIEENPNLKTTLQEHIEARANIRIAGEATLKNRFLKEFESETPEAKQESKPSNRILKALLIGILLGASMMAAYILFFTNKVEANEEPLIFAMVEDPSYDLLRGEADTTSVDFWREAVQSFVNKDYETSLTYLKGIDTASDFMKNHGGKFSLMKGVAHFKLKEFESAETELATITSANPYYDQAEWYLALTAYFNDKPTLANNRLNQIKENQNHYRKKKAMELLRQLE